MSQNTPSPDDDPEAQLPPEDPDAYDKWFREQVAIGLAEADDPNAEWISHEEAQKLLRLRISEWEKRAKDA